MNSIVQYKAVAQCGQGGRWSKNQIQKFCGRHISLVPQKAFKAEEEKKHNVSIDLALQDEMRRAPADPRRRSERSSFSSGSSQPSNHSKFVLAGNSNLPVPAARTPYPDSSSSQQTPPPPKRFLSSALQQFYRLVQPDIIQEIENILHAVSVRLLSKGAKEICQIHAISGV